VTTVARYPLISYRYDIALATGTVATRIHCPHCGALHFDIWEGEERLCFGCGHILTVYGLELVALQVPEGLYEDEDLYSTEDPDNPNFWYGLGN
jgi:hypothetical protein